MIKKIWKIKNWMMLSLVLPAIYGCQGGGGGGTPLGSLFGSTGLTGDTGNSALASSADLFSPLSVALGNDGGTTAAAAVGVITNPEPATMVLLGSGILLMARFNNRKK